MARIYLKYLQITSPYYFSNEDIIHKDYNGFENNNFDRMSSMAYIMTICELNNIEVDLYEYESHYESPSKNLLYSPRSDIDLLYYPNFNCLRIINNYPNFEVFSPIIKKYFLKLNFNQSEASIKSSSQSELSKLVGGIVILVGRAGRHAVSFTICEGELIVSNWSNTFNTGTVQGLNNLDYHLKSLYDDGFILETIYLMYEVSIQKEIIKSRKKNGN